MLKEDGERDYLVTAQLPHDPTSFIELVKEAFLLEHNCSTQQEIAKVLGRDKSRITQIFGDPKRLKAETVEQLIAKLKGRTHRRRIVEAWVRECFGPEILYERSGHLVGREVTEKTVRRVDRMIRQSRLAAAASTAMQASKRTKDQVLRDVLLDRAAFTYQRLDYPGRAMGAVREIAEAARERGDTPRVAGALLMKASILERLPNSTPEDLEPVFEKIHQMLAISEPVDQRTVPYVVGSVRLLESARFRAELTFCERRLLEPDTELLKARLADLQKRVKKSASYQSRFNNYYAAARIHLLLGETFQAEECLDQAFSQGELKNLNAYELCSLLKSRIMKRTERLEEVSRYLREVSTNCAQTQDYYHKRVAEYDLARIESELFPDV